MLDWKKCILKDICKTNASSYSAKENWEYVNYLDTGNITENKIDEIQYIDLKESKLPSRAKRKVELNSIIYSTVRPNQKHYGIIKEIPDNFLVSTGFIVIDIDETKADPDFIFYALTQRELTEHLHSVAEQSTSAYPSIKPSDLESVELLLPELCVQKQISGMLKSLSDKVKVNEKINRNLKLAA